MLETGSVIDGKYKILNVIGRGGMSTVYLAMNERVNRQWAVKEILKNDVHHLHANKREIEMMKKLKHPHLPGIVDVIENQDSLLIVMDYIEGRSLQDILSEYGAQTQKDVLKWAKQLCDVLSYLHTRKPAVIYRDMKPANVMLKPDGNIMLIDFGAAREYKYQNSKDTISLGTRGYAAPEQYERKGQSDARTDIYCLGVMLFQLLTGESPHVLCPICQINPSLSSGLEAVLVKCTQVKKENRYQSCQELMYALEHYFEWDAEYQKQQRKKLVPFMASLMLTAALEAGAVFFAWKRMEARNHNYEAYLLAARNAVSAEDAVRNYRNAAALDPARKEAYLELLEEVFLDDDVLTAEESEVLRSVLIAYGDGKQTNEQAFQRNQSGYEEFAYAAGIAYYYKYEEKSNKKNAKIYLGIAAASERLDEKKTERSRRLAVIADYYSRVGMIDEAGDMSITYRDYWEDLTALSAGNLVEMDNERTALVMYEELVSQICTRTAEFRDSGVEKEEMQQQLSNIREHLQTDFTAPKDHRRSLIEDEIHALLKQVESAERMLWSVCTQEEEE